MGDGAPPAQSINIIRETLNQAPGPTKQFFVPVGARYDANTVAYEPLAAYSGFSVASLRITNDYCNTNFKVPHDFKSIVSVYILYIGRETASNQGITLSVNYGAEGESPGTHLESWSGASYTYNVTNNTIEKLDITTLITSLTKDDYLGVEVLLYDGVDIDVIGIMFYYN